MPCSASGPCWEEDLGSQRLEYGWIEQARGGLRV